MRRDGKDRDCFNLKKRQIKENVTVVYRMMNDTEKVSWGTLACPFVSTEAEGPPIKQKGKSNNTVERAFLNSNYLVSNGSSSFSMILEHVLRGMQRPLGDEFELSC